MHFQCSSLCAIKHWSGATMDHAHVKLFSFLGFGVQNGPSYPKRPAPCALNTMVCSSNQLPKNEYIPKTNPLSRYVFGYNHVEW